MAKKARTQAKKSAGRKTFVPPKRSAPPLRGGRKAEQLKRQVARLRDKHGFDRSSAGEWLLLALSLRAHSLELEAEALALLGYPQGAAPTARDVARIRAARPEPEPERDPQEEEED